MESKQILDSQIHASSESAPFKAHDARKGHSKAWVPFKTQLENTWIQVDFLVVVRVKKILTQGCPYYRQWVKRYSISYLGYGGNFQNVKESDGKIKVMWSFETHLYQGRNLSDILRGGGVYSYNYSCYARRISFEINTNLKEIRRAEHEYMNKHPPPPPN